MSNSRPHSHPSPMEHAQDVPHLVYTAEDLHVVRLESLKLEIDAVMSLNQPDANVSRPATGYADGLRDAHAAIVAAHIDRMRATKKPGTS